MLPDPGQDSAVLHRDLTKHYKQFARGEGSYLIDDQGRRYLDAAGGVAVNVIGHGERRITDAIAAHADELNYVYGAAFTSLWQEQLARILASVTPLSGPRVFFCSGGSEANETAVKLARQYHVERGEPRRWKVMPAGRAITATRSGCCRSRAGRAGGPSMTRTSFRRRTSPRRTATGARSG